MLIERLPAVDAEWLETEGRATRQTLRTAVSPSDIRDVAKVQIWCAFAETVLGEAAFDPPVR